MDILCFVLFLIVAMYCIIKILLYIFFDDEWKEEFVDEYFIFLRSKLVAMLSIGN